MTKKNPILTTIDYEKEGKQTGYLRLPHSVHRSAYGWLPFPVACIRNGEGPTDILLSGTHGDEYEGQVTLSKLIHQLEPKDIKGRLIILPMLNFPAAKAAFWTAEVFPGPIMKNYVFTGRDTIQKNVGNASLTPTYSDFK